MTSNNKPSKPMTKVNLTVDIEYEMTDAAAAPASTIRIPGQIHHIIIEASAGVPSRVNPDTVKVTVTKKMIDGKPIK